MGDILQLHSSDDVAVVLRSGGLAAGDAWQVGRHSGVALVRIPHGHKLALRDLSPGDEILKYGHPIAVATERIAAGDHVHVHNAAMPPQREEAARPIRAHLAPPPSWSELPAVFSGYRRANGASGTRNYVAVAASVNCSATVVKAIARGFIDRDLSAAGIHGIVPLTHGMGCAQAIGGAGYRLLNRTLAGSIFHPNVVGAVVVGLGCEGTTFASILDARARQGRQGEIPLDRVGIQDVGGTEEAIRAHPEQWVWVHARWKNRPNGETP